MVGEISRNALFFSANNNRCSVLIDSQSQLLGLREIIAGLRGCYSVFEKSRL